MLVAVNWIKNYVDLDMGTRDLADALTLSGTHVESIKDLSKGLDRIVVGRVLEITDHPDADKLVVCQIDVGQERVQVVTGAPNIEEDAYVIVALEGAKMADGMIIEKTKLRGVESNGMCCSYQELGVADSLIPKKYRDGIVLLNGEFEPGEPIAKALNFDDEVLELEITPNRPDCLSILGIAREASASTGSPMTYPNIDLDKIENEVNFQGEISTKKCDKLVLLAITDVEIKESPLWLQTYLIKSGMRPINNIVDITNFVMLEYGQPLHAYDLDSLRDNKLIVSEAQDGDELVSLDGEKRKLKEGDITIRDGDRIIGLAGIMGGFDTEVTDKTKNVLIESATFDKKQIRQTSQRLGLRSEASSRFEKGVSPYYCLDAGKRALYLVEEIGAGKHSSTIEIIDNTDEGKALVDVSYDRANNLLGTDIKKEKMLEYLQRLEFEVEDKGDFARAQVPGFRSDIEIEEDLIEEIGRIYGFYNISPQKIKGDLVQGKVSDNKRKEYKLKNNLFALGYSEVLTYSFVSPNQNKRAGIDNDKLNDFISIENPLGEEFSVMRTSLVGNHLDILSRNIKNNIKEFSTFELGNIFIKSDDDYCEKRRLLISSYGDVDFYSFKADFLALMEKAGIDNIKFIKEEDISLFHPGRCAKMTISDELLGYMGEVSYATSEEYSINKRAYILEADLDLINKLTVEEQTYSKISKYPAVIRDISIVVNKDRTHDEIEKIIRKNDDEIISKIKLIDIYTGDQIDDDEKSLTYEIIYRSDNRTLVEEEVNEIQDKIIKSLENEDIHLRK